MIINNPNIKLYQDLIRKKEKSRDIKVVEYLNIQIEKLRSQIYNNVREIQNGKPN